MIEDRDYMRQPEYKDSGWRPSFRLRWSWTVILLLVYLVVFIGELIAAKWFPNNHLFHGYTVLGDQGIEFRPGFLPLSLAGVEHGYLWQLVTYQFMHAGWMHLFMNSWMIYMFGRELEDHLGAKRFLALVFSSGIVGGVMQMLAAFLWPQYFGGSVVGASAAGFGLVAAYAALFPAMQMRLLLFFIIPVTITAKTLLIASAVFALAGFAFPDVIFPGVAHMAHLGGMAMGWVFIRKILQGDWSRLSGSVYPAEKRKQLRVGDEANDEESFNEDDVNRILDKISAQGIQSLTKREREILETARKKMTRP
jgi:membrane associated rhomboid family serine protease